MKIGDTEGMRRRHEERKKTMPFKNDMLPEAAIENLKHVAKRYSDMVAASNVKVVKSVGNLSLGDIVTPTSWSNIKGHGEPMIICEIIQRAEPDFRVGELQDTGSPLYGQRPDIRVAKCFKDGSVGMYWDESFKFMSYNEHLLDKAEAQGRA